ncbi:MAG: serine hydrolase [Spirosomataceae bacterium]
MNQRTLFFVKMTNKMTASRRTVSVCLFLWIATLTVFAQSKADKMDALMRQYVENRQFNGSVLVAENGKVIFKKGYGMANMEWDIPNAPDTKFRLGSITKQFTSMLVMQLAEKGKIKLNDKITTYLPDYPKATGDKVTIHHLLTHTSGIPSYTNFPKFFENLSRDPFTPQVFVKQFCDLPLEFEPGSAFAYNNSGYFLLGVIIEKVTGKPYAQVLQEQILTPLQMNNTGYDLHEPILAKRASGYEKRGAKYVNAAYLDMTIPYAAGSMYSTVEDLYLWDQALYTDKLISASSKATLFTPFLSNYAYGWGVEKMKMGELKDSLQVIEHSGGINGFNTILTRIPKDKQLVVLLNNTGGAPLGAIRKNLLNILYNQPVTPPKKSVADAFRQTLLSSSLEKAVQQFQTLKTDKAYLLNENEMNALGYELLGEGKKKEALAVFDLNVQAFPNSFNVYDSRGEAYMAIGDKAASIKDYKKSLELNPRNTGGIEKLKELGEKAEAPKDVVVPGSVLETYAGDYQLAPNFILTVTKEGDKLITQATGQQKIEIFAESETKFYPKVMQATIEFVKDETGKVTKLILNQGGRTIEAKKIK